MRPSLFIMISALFKQKKKREQKILYKKSKSKLTEVNCQFVN